MRRDADVGELCCRCVSVGKAVLCSTETEKVQNEKINTTPVSEIDVAPPLSLSLPVVGEK